MLTPPIDCCHVQRDSSKYGALWPQCPVKCGDVGVNAAMWGAALSPLDPDDRPTSVTKRLRQAIELGLLPDGMMLPSETDLAVQVGVSKVTLRSALATLREQGLVETRRGHGGGSFVRHGDPTDARSLLRQLAEWQLDDLRDLRDLHTAVAGAAAALAVERVRGITLRRLIDSARLVGATSDLDEARRADFRFHLELAASTRSTQITRVEMSIQGEIAPFLWIPGSPACSPESMSQAHAAIMDAVAVRDRAQARELAEQHVADALNAIIELRMTMDGGPA